MPTLRSFVSQRRMSGRLAHKIGTLACIVHRKRCPESASLQGSLLFCPDCGTLLNYPEDGKPDIPCEQCGHLEPASCELLAVYTPRAHISDIACRFIAYENIEIITRSHPDAFPSALHQKRKTQTKVISSQDALLKACSGSAPYIFS